MKRIALLVAIASIASSAVFIGDMSFTGADAAPDNSAKIDPAITAAFARGERYVDVIASLREPAGAPTAGDTRSLTIAASQQRVITQVGDAAQFVYDPPEQVPAVVMRVDEEGVALATASADVVKVTLDAPILKVQLAEAGALINADDAHALGATGDGVVVAVIDTGIDTNHPGLADDILYQRCFRSAANDCAGGFATGTNAEDTALNGHGTHVSGIITSSLLAAPGLAPDAQIAAYRICDTVCPLSDAVLALDDIIANHPEVDVVNMSFGTGSVFAAGTCEFLLPAMTSAINTLRASGVPSFVSSGNSSASTGLSFPACISSAISVGATIDANGADFCIPNQIDNILCISNSDASLDLLAPGSMITSTFNNGGTIAYRGTSMAAPAAAAVSALLEDASPGLSVNDIETRLSHTGVPILDPRNGVTVCRVDALAAVTNVTNATCVNPPPPPPTATNTSTATHTFTPTPTNTTTATPTHTATNTNTATTTSTSTPINTATNTPTETPAASSTPTQTPSPTSTPTNTETATLTPTDTATPSPTETNTPVPTATPTQFATNTMTATSTATAAAADPFFVNSTNDAPDAVAGDGACETAVADECTLRAAMQEAAALAGPDVIHFDISGAGVHTIAVGSHLGAIEGVIDGTTQPQYAGVPLIEIKPAVALQRGIILSGSSTIRGLSIHSFGTQLLASSSQGGSLIEHNYVGLSPDETPSGVASAGILVDRSHENVIRNNVISGGQTGIVLLYPVMSGPEGPWGTRIENNRIGTNAAGTAAIGNTGDGIQVNRVPSDPEPYMSPIVISGNTISGNAGAGLRLYPSAEVEIIVASNIIGADGTAEQPMPNGAGIVAAASAPGKGIVIGGTGTENVIAFNTGHGVSITTNGYFDGVGVPDVSVRANSIHSNGGLGIDIGEDGVTPNDLADADAGPNGLQNYPEITSAISDGAILTIDGTLNSLPDGTYDLGLYANSVCDVSGFGEGETLLATTQVTTDSNGDASFNVLVNSTDLPDGISATASGAFGDTSEFSTCEPVTITGPPTATPTATATATATPTPTQVPDFAQEFVEAASGAIVDTGDQATSGDVAVTEIEIPAGAAVGDFTLTIDESPATGLAGFSVFGQQVDIDAQGMIFSPPAIITFSFDSSVVGGIAPGDVVIFRNLVPVANCVSVGDPQPCVIDVTLNGENDMVVRIATNALSSWTAGAADDDGDGYPNQREASLVENPNTFCWIMRADVNQNGVVNSLDLLQASFGFSPNYVARSDQNGSGTINSLDLLLISFQFGRFVSECDD